MKPSFSNIIILLLLTWVVAGSLIITYFQNFDGTLFNPPISFKVDTQHLVTDKTSYHRGDTISVQFSYCRYRSFTAISQWSIVNEFSTSYAAIRYVLQPECVTDKWRQIGIVPPDALSGTHHLEGTTQVQINPLRNVYYNYRSANFQVI